VIRCPEWRPPRVEAIPFGAFFVCLPTNELFVTMACEAAGHPAGTASQREHPGTGANGEDGMTIGGRHFTMKRRWLALFSLAWMAVVYVVWTLLYSPNAGLLWARGQAQCASLETAPYAHAECLKFAAQIVNSRQADVAETAALVAILPVALLWLLWFAAHFFQVCRSVECGKPTSR